MTAAEFAAWLTAHHHDDVNVLDDATVVSTYKEKRRAYELVPAVMSDGSLFGGDIERGPYWKRVKP